MLWEGILMLVLENKFCLGRLLRSNYSIISGPHWTRMLGEGILMLGLDTKFSPWKAAAQQLF